MLVAGLTLGAAAQLKYNKYHAPMKVEKKAEYYDRMFQEIGLK